MKNRILGAALAALFTTSALAQVNVVPQPGLATGYLAKTTYSSSFYGLVPVTGATDLVCIAGSATKTIRVQRITISGTVATATIQFPVNLVRRASLDTGGTAASTTANPGVTTQIASRDTGQATNASATATLVSYTANPTINDTSPVYIDSQMLFLPLTTTGVAANQVDFFFARDVENLVQLPTLRGTAQQICVNLAGVTLANAAALNGSVVWTEE